MNAAWWEGPVRFVGDYWWILLIVLVLALTAYLLRDLWLPELLTAFGL